MSPCSFTIPSSSLYLQSVLQILPSSRSEESMSRDHQLNVSHPRSALSPSCFSPRGVPDFAVWKSPSHLLCTQQSTGLVPRGPYLTNADLSQWVNAGIFGSWRRQSSRTWHGNLERLIRIDQQLSIVEPRQ